MDSICGSRKKGRVLARGMVFYLTHEVQGPQQDTLDKLWTEALGRFKSTAKKELNDDVNVLRAMGRTDIHDDAPQRDLVTALGEEIEAFKQDWISAILQFPITYTR